MAGGIAELFYDPLRLAYDQGRYIAPIGGHSDHVHVSFDTPAAALTAIEHAQALGLRAGENPYTGTVTQGVHVGDSYHYRTFPGRYDGRQLGQAIDVTGPANQMAAFARWVNDNLVGPGSTASSVPPSSSGTVASSSPSTVAATSAAGAGCLLPALLQVGLLAGVLFAAGVHFL